MFNSISIEVSYDPILFNYAASIVFSIVSNANIFIFKYFDFNLKESKEKYFDT